MKLAVVRIRGRRNINPRIARTMELLNLNRMHHCVLVEGTPQNKGMLQKCKDYVTYGPISEKTLILLLKKRGEKGGKMLREIMEDGEMEQAAKKILHEESVKDFVDPVFRLHPPRRGYKDVKKAATVGGELGKREEMDSLIRKMM